MEKRGISVKERTEVKEREVMKERSVNVERKQMMDPQMEKKERKRVNEERKRRALDSDGNTRERLIIDDRSCTMVERDKWMKKKHTDRGQENENKKTGG